MSAKGGSENLEAQSEDLRLKVAEYESEIKDLKSKLTVMGMAHMMPTSKELLKPPKGVFDEILKAAEYNDVEMMAELIKPRWKLDILSQEGTSPLHIAAKNGNHRIFQLLVRKGASIAFEDDDGKTAMEVGEENGHTDALSEAVTEELLAAAANNDLSILDRLVGSGWDINARDKYGMTALHKAASQGRKFVCMRLLDMGADIEAKDLENDTPLQKAMAKNHDVVVSFLIARGARGGLCKMDENAANHPKPGVTGTLKKLFAAASRRHVVGVDGSGDPDSSTGSKTPLPSASFVDKKMLDYFEEKNVKKNGQDDTLTNDEEYKLWGEYLRGQSLVKGHDS